MDSFKPSNNKDKMIDNRNHKSVIEVITKIEETFDVNKLTYKNLNIWPWIRLNLWTQLNNPNKMYGPEKSIISEYILDERRKNHINDLKRNENVDTIFFSRVEDYTDKANNKFYNRHIDPMIDLVKENFSFVKLELSNSKTKNTVPRFEKTIFLNNPIKNHFSAHKKILSISSFDKLKQCVGQIEKRIVLNEFALIEELNMLECYSQYFEEIFNAIRPKVVFFACYYYMIPMAIIKACKKLGIATVDIQHGKQGKFHGMYSYWTKIPLQGYEMLPDFFWCWGAESKINIEISRKNAGNYHIPLTGGNQWLASWLEGKEGIFESDISEKFYTILDNKTKKILISLQPFDEKIPLPEHVIETMRNSPIDWLWLLRLHPLRRQDEERLKLLLTEKRIQNFEIHHTTVSPLYSILKIADHHITYYSSVCYEALAFGVHTTIIDPSGLTLYEEYIKNGIFNYADSMEALVGSINKTIGDKQFIEKTPYIETNKNVAEKALEKIYYKYKHLQEGLMSKEQDNLKEAEKLNQIGKELFENNDIAGAITVLNESIKKNIEFVESHNDLGYLYWKIGEVEKSIYHFEKALDIEPTNRNAVINYGLILASLNRKKEAENLYSKYLENNPLDEQILNIKKKFQIKKKSENNNIKIGYETLWEEKLNDPLWLKNDGKGRVEYCANFLNTNFKLNGNTKLLDVGCGRGTLALYLDSKISLYGIDISETAIAHTKKKYNQADQINLDEENLPYDNGFFDFVVALDVIEHVYDPLSLINKMQGVLKDDGKLILSTPNILYEKYLKDLVRTRKFPKTSDDDFPYDGGHIHFFTYQDLIDLMRKADLKTKSIGPYKHQFDYEFKEATVWILAEKM